MYVYFLEGPIYLELTVSNFTFSWWRFFFGFLFVSFFHYQLRAWNTSDTFSSPQYVVFFFSFSFSHSPPTQKGSRHARHIFKPRVLFFSFFPFFPLSFILYLWFFTCRLRERLRRKHNTTIVLFSRQVARTADHPNKDGPCCLGQWRQQAKPEATAHQRDQTISSWGWALVGRSKTITQGRLIAITHSVAGMLLTLGCC